MDHKNLGLIDVDSCSRELQDLALFLGWEVHGTLSTLFWMHRPAASGARRLYLSSGIHGDEPAGPLALVELLKRSDWMEDLEIWIFPLLNPEGLRRGTRESPDGVDLNRDYRNTRSLEITRHVEILKTLPCLDASVCLHEDWEAQGCYLYFLRDDPGPAWAIPVLEAMSAHVPVDMSPLIDGFDAVEGKIERNHTLLERPEWAEALYLIRNHTQCCFTLETPSGFPLESRVSALRDAVIATAQQLRAMP